MEQEATRPLAWNIHNIWLMYALLVPTLAGMGWGIWRHVQFWRLGQPEVRWDRPLERLKRVGAHALGQGRVLGRRVFGKVHAALVWTMILLFGGTFVAMLEMDFHIPIMRGWFYLIYQSLILDGAGVIATLALIGFFVRKALVGEAGATKRDRPARWTLPDWGLPAILLVLCVQGFLLEAIRIAGTDDPWAHWSPVGRAMALLLDGLPLETLITGFQVLWWTHYMTTNLLWVTLPFSNLFHIVTSPLSIFFSNIDAPRKELRVIDFETSEQFGVSRVQDLRWKDLLDLDACTACGRCDDVCPATNTGKMLRPRTIILNLRDHLTREVGPPLVLARQATRPSGPADGAAAIGAGAGVAAIGAGGAAASVADPEPPRPLLGDVIPEQMLWDCTTCRACMRACPVYIEHVPKIVDMRRALVLMESRFPPELTGVFRGLEVAGNPWQFPNDTRADWAQGLDVPIYHDTVPADVEYLFWVGCYGSFDGRNKKVSVALARVMRRAGLKVGILGPREKCCGDPARRAGNEYLYSMLVQENIETLTGAGVRKIVTACPHCFNNLKNEFPDFGGQFEVVHHSQVIADLVAHGRLTLDRPLEQTVTYHDPCYLGRYNGVFDAPRFVLEKIPELKIVEMEKKRERSFCCGAGGARGFMEEPPGQRVNDARVAQAEQTGAGTLAVSCPFCMNMFQDGIQSRGAPLVGEDIAELAERASRPKAEGTTPGTA